MPDRAGFLLAEDQALKVKFSGIQLVDDRDTTRDVSVFLGTTLARCDLVI